MRKVLAKNTNPGKGKFCYFFLRIGSWPYGGNNFSFHTYPMLQCSCLYNKNFIFLSFQLSTRVHCIEIIKQNSRKSHSAKQIPCDYMKNNSFFQVNSSGYINFAVLQKQIFHAILQLAKTKVYARFAVQSCIASNLTKKPAQLSRR